MRYISAFVSGFFIVSETGKSAYASAVFFGLCAILLGIDEIRDKLKK
jgi:uncharacterized membrane protein HdeD (DUF308 family)